MNAKKGYYSLIQYCPDLMRLEAVNVGVLLFCPSMENYLQVKVTSTNRRVRKFFGDEAGDLRQIQLIKEGLQSHLNLEDTHIDSLEKLQRFIRMQANQLQLTEPRSMRITNPAKDLNDLFVELFGEESLHKPKESFKQKLWHDFKQLNITDRIAKWPQLPRQLAPYDFKADFAYQNGSLNFLKIHDFSRITKGTTVLHKVCSDAIIGQKLSRLDYSDQSHRKLLVLGQFPAKEEGLITETRGIFEEHEVAFYTQDDKKKLLEEIAKAKELPENLKFKS